MGHLDEAMLFAVEGRLGPFATGKVYCSLIGACEDVGDYNRAAEWTEATQRWAEAHPFAIFPGVCRVHRAIILKRSGALEEAEQEAARACDELRGSHVPNSAAALAEVGDIRRRLGDLEAAEEAFARFREVGGGPCGGLALLRLAQGRNQEAMEIAISCVASQANPLGRAGVLPVLAQVALAAGDAGAAGRALDELAGTAERMSIPELHAAERSTRGRVQLAAGRPGRAGHAPGGGGGVAGAGRAVRGGDRPHAGRPGAAPRRRRGGRGGLLRGGRRPVRPDRRPARVAARARTTRSGSSRRASPSGRSRCCASSPPA